MELEPSWYNDGHSMWDDEDKGDKESYAINKGKLEALGDDVYNSKSYVSEGLLFLDDVENAVSDLIKHDKDVASSLKIINSDKYEMSNSNTVTNSGIDRDVADLVNKLDQPEGMSDAEFEEYKAEYKTQLESLRDEGWDKDALAEYGNFVSENVTSKEDLISAFSNTKIIGSEVYTRMFDNSKLCAVDKLKLMRKQMEELGYPMEPDMDYEVSDGVNFFDIVDQTVVESEIFVDDKYGDVMFDWIHFELRTALNQAGAFAPYEGMSDEETLIAMIDDKWRFSGENAQDVINKSRYHAILPEGYSSYEEFERLNGYDLRCNVKILSEDGRFERIYNLKEKRFVDTNKFMYAENSENQSDLFKSTAINMPTYNYGNYKNEQSHDLYDVQPFKDANGSMRDPSTKMDVSGYESKKNYYKNMLPDSFPKQYHNIFGGFNSVDEIEMGINGLNSDFEDTEGIPFKEKE